MQFVSNFKKSLSPIKWLNDNYVVEAFVEINRDFILKNTKD